RRWLELDVVRGQLEAQRRHAARDGERRLRDGADYAGVAGCGRAAHAAASEARPGVVVCESAEDRGFLAGILDQQETRSEVRHRALYERCRNGVCGDGTDEGVAGDGPLCPRANEPDTV